MLAAYLGDQAGVDEALARTRDSRVPADYPTVGQLQQVLLAEQERLAGKPRAAVARLRPIIKRDDALVAAHWAMMRAEQATGNAEGTQVQGKWLATRRGRVFTEATTTEVLRFFNVAVSREALLSNAEPTANPLAAPAARGATQSAGKPH